MTSSISKIFTQNRHMKIIRNQSRAGQSKHSSPTLDGPAAGPAGISQHVRRRAAATLTDSYMIDCPEPGVSRHPQFENC